ncbi:hypothetical protein CH295_26065 [Rhodococcus sp. 14-2483-1-2]|nr:hypothetical protein CH295_26065 [Rhodococcus sp. 14-2483-1-2]
MLTAELAQRVVDQVRPVVTYNVNIMDDRGFIIASVDPSRLGRLHHGAVHALERRDTVHIDARSAEPDTRAGVNVPLFIDDIPVGVVGVTGTPSTVEPVARVLVLTVSLLIRQEQHLDDSRWRESALRDLLNALIVESTVSEGRMMSKLRDVGKPLRPPWTVLVARSGSSRPTQVSRHRNSVVGIENAVAVERDGTLWFLVGSSSTSTRAVVIDRLAAAGASVVAGRAGATMAELIVDVQKLDVLVRNYVSDSRVHELSEFDVEVLIGRQPDFITIDSVRRIVEPLTNTLRETAGVLIANNLSVVASASLLHTHRNTVVQRLGRIKELTGLDLRLFEDAVAMKLALASARQLTTGDVDD